jgi:membrane associated rhomboid family serine protease
MFLHGGIGHLLFNMLALWMFGTDLERTWGTRFFTKYYFVTGVGAAATMLVLSFFMDSMYNATTIGASGAIYGLLVAYAIYFPHRTIFFIIFPLPARVFVALAAVLAFVYSRDSGSGVAHAAHLGGLVVGYLYLKSLRARPMDELKYRYMKWKMGRARSKFDVYSGGRSSDDDWKSDWKKHIH